MNVSQPEQSKHQTSSEPQVAVMPYGEPGPLSKVFEKLIEVSGHPIAQSPTSAQIVICFDLKSASEHLKADRSVIQVTGFFRRDDAILTAAAPPEWHERYRVIDGISNCFVQLLNALHDLSQIKLPATQPSAQELGLPQDLQKSSLQSKRILVLDDTENNRLAAKYQFADTNEVAEFSSYKSAVEALRQDKYDLVLLDLLMGPEAFMLSNSAFARVAGSDFPAGAIVALVASLQPGTQVSVITDASHHDHPATALLDFLWNKPIELANGSSVVFRQAVTLSLPGGAGRIKDWVASVDSRG